MAGFTIEARELRNAGAWLAHAWQSRNTIPVLSHVLIEATKDLVTFRTTDLDLEAATWSDATDGHVLVEGPCRFTMDLGAMRRIAAAATGTVKFCHEKPQKGAETLTVTSADFTLKMHLLCPPEDWPELMQEGSRTSFYATCTTTGATHQDIHRAFRLARHCISKEETRYYLNGVYMHPATETGTLRIVATNGYQLARIDSDIPWNGPSGIVPTKTVTAILDATAKSGNGEVRLSMSPSDNTGRSFLMLETGTVRITSKLIDGTYPDYTRVIPKGPENRSATLSLAQLQVMARLTGGGERVIAAAIDGKRQCIWSKQYGSELEVSVPANVRGEGAGFNIKYLMAQARVTPTFQIAGEDKGAPAIVRGEDTKALWVLMPMRVDL